MMTLSKLAALAHVSVSTASKAFSMNAEVNDETRELIFKIAKEYGCFKKFYNAKYPKFVISVICPEFDSLHYTAAISTIQKCCTEYNCEVCCASTEFSDEKATALLDYYSKYTSVDGIILIDSLRNNSFDLEIPVVRIGNSYGEEYSIITEFESSFIQAIEYFKENKINKIGFIGETKTKIKSDIFIEIMGDDLQPDSISITEKRFEEGGYMAMRRFFEKGNIPRAIICAYDYMAIGAIRCIIDNGLKVPEDVAVLGMDDIPESKYLNPSLSTINTHIKDACKNAVDVLMCKLTGKNHSINTSVKAELILRESTKL